MVIRTKDRKNNVVKFLTRNNNQYLHAFSKNEIGVNDIAKITNVSRQYISSEVTKLDENIFKKRQDDLISRLEKTYATLMEGVSVRNVVLMPYAKPIFLKGSNHVEDEVYLRNKIINRFKQYNIMKCDDDKEFIQTSKKVKWMVNTIELLDILRNEYMTGNMTLKEISKQTNVSFGKVSKFKNRLYEGKYPIDSMTHEIFSLALRNIDIANQFLDGATMEEVQENYPELDTVMLKLINDSYKHYIT